MPAISLAVTPEGSDNPGSAITSKSTQKVTKVSDRVAIAITEAFHKLAGDDVERDREALLEWFRERQK